MQMHKNTRDFQGKVINPRDHFVLPNAERLSRDDVRAMLQSAEVWKHDPQFETMRTLVPEMYTYLSTPPPGNPTYSKEAKTRGLGSKAARVSGESKFERVRRANSADRASRINESRQFARNDRVNANRPGMYAPYAPAPGVAIPRAATKRKK